MWEKIKGLRKQAVDLVVWAETELKELPGAEKREAVIRRLDDMLQLPACLEWLDDILIGKVVDLAVSGLNIAFGHNFGAAEISEEKKEEIAGEIGEVE